MQGNLRKERLIGKMEIEIEMKTKDKEIWNHITCSNETINARDKDDAMYGGQEQGHAINAGSDAQKEKE